VKKVNPVIGIDVANGNSVATACKSLNDVFRCISFSHTVTGFNQLQSTMTDLELVTGMRPEIILEATGHYSMPLCRYFKENSYVCHVINPYVSSRFNQRGLRKLKTDKVDSLALCKLYYLEKLEQKPSCVYEYSDDKALSRACRTAINNTVRQKVRCRALIDRCFPGFDQLFHDPFSADALTLLQAFPHPDLVNKIRPNVVTLKIKSACPEHRSRWCQEKSLALRALAQECYPAAALDSIQVRLLIDAVEQLQGQIQLVEKLRQELVEKMRPNPQFALIAGIPGFGEQQAAEFLAEIGDVRRFETPQQLVAYCGTEPGVYESGAFKGTRQHLSKHGNTYLRSTLYMAVFGMVNFKTNPVIRAYYEKKRLCEGKPYKVAIFACVNKLLRIVFALCTREVQFTA
jgi:transposase